ncbi:MAG TPA: response regulator [Cyclobacteriaceae bacterium]
MNENKISLMVVDDHDMVRQGLESALKFFDSFEIIASLKNGFLALEKLKEVKPDVILLDIIMPKMNGLETAEEIKKHYPDVKTIVLSMDITSEYIKKAMEANVDGYIPKNADIEILVNAIKSVYGGQTYYDQEVKEFVFKQFKNEDQDKIPNIENISEREIQVLKLIAEGYSNKEIGEKLFISHKTVEAHRGNILRKLKLNSNAELIKFALARNLTEIPKHMYLD